VSPDFQQPLVMQGSAGVDYQIASDLAVSVSYLNAKGRYLHRYRDVNLDPSTTTQSIGVADTTLRLSYQVYPTARPIPGFNRVLLLDSSGISAYHALAVQVRKQFSHGFQVRGAYTWSRGRDENSNLTPVEVPNDDSQLLSDSLQPHRDWGPTPADLRHRLTLSGVWVLDYANGLPPLGRALLSGWEVSGVLTAQTGFAYSARVNSDLNNDGNNATDRTPGTPRNSYRMPAIVTFDPRVTRAFHVGGRARLRLIAEAFNIFNRTNVTAVMATQYSVSNSASSCGMAGTPCLVKQANFGRPTDTLGPRVVQLALRLTF
jgi:hypothetical protein